MKTLFETFKKSLHNPEFYRAVSGASLGEALRYYVKVVFILAVIATVAFSIILVPRGVRFIRDVAPSLVRDYYPADMVVTIEKGHASTNIVEPFIVISKGVTHDVLREDGLDNLFVIDTGHDFNVKMFEDHKTLVLLTKTEVVTQNRKGNITIQSLRSTPDMVIDQAKLLVFVEKIRAGLPYFVPVGIVVTLVSLFFGYMIYLIPLFLFALIPFLLVRVRRVPLTYGGAYKMSMYAVVPGLALKTLFNIGGFFFVPAYLSLLVFTLIVFINMREVEQPTLFTGNE